MQTPIMRTYRSNKEERFNRKDKALSAAIAAFFFLNVLCTKGRSFIPLSKLTMNLILYGVTAILVLNGIRYLKKQQFLMLFLGEAIFAVGYLYTYIRGNLDTESAVVYLTLTMVACVPFFVFITAIDDLECLYRALKIATFPSMLVLVRCFQIAYRGSDYDIKFSYLVLMCVAIYFNAALNREKFSLLYWLLGIGGTVMIVTMGSRGTLLCIAVFLVLKIVTQFGESTRAKVIALSALVLVVLAVLYYREILTWAMQILRRFGIYSRTLDMMRKNAILSDSGRGMIFNTAIQMIKDRPILGYGPAGEVLYLDGYVHNLFLELFIDFGVLVGSFLILITLRYVLLYFFMRDRMEKDVALILLASGFFPLMVSDSYLQNPYFFLYMGLALRFVRRRRVERAAVRDRAFETWALSPDGAGNGGT